MTTLPKSGWPVFGQIAVNSVAVSVTDCTSGAGNASALSTSRASAGFLGRGKGPVRGRILLEGSFLGMHNTKPSPVVLFRGGIDSPTTLALARRCAVAP